MSAGSSSYRPTEEAFVASSANSVCHEGFGYEAIIDSLAVCTFWKESSVIPSLATEQVLLFANPAVPDLLEVGVDDEARST
jgi:hypothetical protein